MTYIMSQFTVPSASTVAICVIPPGLGSYVIWSGATTPVYIGTSNRVSPASGMVLSSIPTDWKSFASSSGVTLYAANTAGVNAIVNFSGVTGQ